jgi:hypothetical protein
MLEMSLTRKVFIQLSLASPRCNATKNNNRRPMAISGYFRSEIHTKTKSPPRKTFHYLLV